MVRAMWLYNNTTNRACLAILLLRARSTAGKIWTEGVGWMVRAMWPYNNTTNSACLAILLLRARSTAGKIWTEGGGVNRQGDVTLEQYYKQRLSRYLTLESSQHGREDLNREGVGWMVRAMWLYNNTTNSACLDILLLRARSTAGKIWTEGVGWIVRAMWLYNNTTTERQNENWTWTSVVGVSPVIEHRPTLEWSLTEH